MLTLGAWPILDYDDDPDDLVPKTAREVQLRCLR